MQYLSDFSDPSLWLAFFLGLIWGSFYNVLIVRLPLDESIRGRSRCPRCKAMIPWYLNVPVLSYLWLRGRCRQCKESISWEYPLIELLTGIVFAWIWVHDGWSLAFPFHALFHSLLLVISVIDLHHRIIPDELSLTGIVAGIVASLVLPDVSWWQSILGCLAGGGVFLLISIVYEKLAGREGLGGGDVKLLAMIGAWLGIESVLIVILISSAVGSLVGVAWMLISRGNLKTAIPFGPFLAAAGFIYAFWGRELGALLYHGMVGP